jgi:hypothetical protein
MAEEALEVTEVTDPPAGDPPPSDPPADDPPANLGERLASNDPATGWRGDWRDAMAGGDAEFRTRLDRFASPQAVAEWGKNAEMMFKQGVGSDPFPGEGSDEDKTKWRATNGIPEEASGYADKLPEGFEMSEADKPYLDAFHEKAHELNISPEAANTLMESVYGIASGQEKSYAEQDVLDADRTATVLQDEYGKETKAAATAAVALISTMGEEAAEEFANARTADGIALVNHPGITRWLINLAYQVNPGGITAPAEGSQEATGLASEKQDLETMMSDTKGPYYTDAKDGAGMTKHQSRYAEILKIEENMAKRK